MKNYDDLIRCPPAATGKAHVRTKPPRKRVKSRGSDRYWIRVLERYNTKMEAKGFINFDVHVVGGKFEDQGI